MAEALLSVAGLDVAFGHFQVLWNVSLEVKAGEIVAMLGPNGSGKSTVLKAIMGICPPKRGTIVYDDGDLVALPVHERVGHGIALVLERRRLFPQMSVRENVLLGAYHRSLVDGAESRFAYVQDLFPIIRERRDQPAGRLSGGEQQMVAIARGLMSRPRLMLMDEPFLGLSPRMVGEVVAIMRKIRDDGIAIVFNEQNVRLSFELADRGYLLESGRVAMSGSGREVLDSDIVRRVYLGQ
jgi:branched-chain amino acid transport system ATP-binding protein